MCQYCPQLLGSFLLLTYNLNLVIYNILIICETGVYYLRKMFHYMKKIRAESLSSLKQRRQGDQRRLSGRAQRVLFSPSAIHLRHRFIQLGWKQTSTQMQVRIIFFLEKSKRDVCKKLRHNILHYCPLIKYQCVYKIPNKGLPTLRKITLEVSW